MIKGGVWKNSEDEVLKAAVMKYGMNQWGRVSSLLVRKSAKQCKARWFEWLDPAIRKTEWTREEDEKLLHLAKLMPTQWRTIAPVVGRTAPQCLERYERLLDQALGRGVEGGEGAGGSDPRRLRSGEIDPNPESRAARPDPVDMDEDEKEMLNEARARLANTRGKKAKRKAREKQLEEAKRLAALQKRREMRAAGIEESHRQKIVGIDYNREIAFQRKPPPGFFDTAEEEEEGRQQQASKQFRPASLDDVDGKRRRASESDPGMRDRARGETAKRKDAPSSLKKLLELNEGSLTVKRGKLALPAPQVGERELAEIARGGAGGSGADEGAQEGAGEAATRVLLPDYRQTPGLAAGRTPLRTPTSGTDTLMEDAAALARRQAAPTPLAGGENVPLRSDFGGITPAQRTAATPSALAGSRGPSATPDVAVPAAPGAGRPETPMRDGLHINREGSTAMTSTAEREGSLVPPGMEALSVGTPAGLLAALKALPPPKNEYQVVVPDMPEIEDDDDDYDSGQENRLPEDAEEVQIRLERKREAEAEAERRKRSQVVQQGLPRLSVEELPGAGDRSVAAPGRASKALLSAASKLLVEEMRLMVEHDAQRHPVAGNSGKKGQAGTSRAGGPRVRSIENDYDAEELREAKLLLEEEAADVRSELGLAEVDTDAVVEALRVAHAETVFVPSKDRRLPEAELSSAERLEAAKHEFQALLQAMQREARRASRLEEKVAIVTKGLHGRHVELCGRLETAWADLDKAKSQFGVYRMLQGYEEVSGPARVEALKGEVAQLKEKEARLQERFGSLRSQLSSLKQQLA